MMNAELFNIWNLKNLYLFSLVTEINQENIKRGIKWNTSSKKSREITSNLEKKWERNKHRKSKLTSQ